MEPKRLSRRCASPHPYARILAPLASSEPVKAQEELEALKEADSEAEEFLQESESQPGMLFQAVRKNFTHPPEGPAAEAKLDQGIRALSVINGRVSVLERFCPTSAPPIAREGAKEREGIKASFILTGWRRTTRVKQ